MFINDEKIVIGFLYTISQVDFEIISVSDEVKKRSESIYYIKSIGDLYIAVSRYSPQNVNCVIAFTVVFFQTFGLVLVPLGTYGRTLEERA